MTTVNDRRFYVYAWLREDGTPYYIGKGQGSRRFSKCGRRGAMPPADKSRNKVVLAGLTDAESAEAEKDLIALFGRKDLGTGCLRNLTDGGEGVCNLTPSAREAISSALTGRATRGRGWSQSPKTREKIQAAQRARAQMAREAREAQGITDEDLAAAKRAYHREYRRRQIASSNGYGSYEEYLQAKQAAKDERAAAKALRQKPAPKSDAERAAERKAYNRAYYLRNREAELARAAAYRQANPLTDEQREQRIEYAREYRLANLEKLRAYDAARHKRQVAA